MIYFGLCILVVISDQWSKHWISSLIPLCQPGQCTSIEITSFFRLTLLHNEGAAFSFLDDAGGWQRWFLITVSAIVSVFLAGWLYQIRGQNRLLSVALSLILGGAVGNLIDRASQGYVVDFLVFHYEAYYFPAFNIADSAISIGAGLLILDMLLPAGSKEVLNDVR